MTQHEEDEVAQSDFVELRNNSLHRENDQEEDFDVCSFQDEDLDEVGGELEFVTIIRIGNEQSEVEVEQFDFDDSDD